MLRHALPADVKTKMTTLLEEMQAKDPKCAYNIASGETGGFKPITHDAYKTMIELRQAQTN